MARCVRSEELSAEDFARRFAAEGFELVVRGMVTGRYLAEATKAAVGGAGPVAMGDTAADAACLAWSRFEAHRSHYLAPDSGSGDRGGSASSLRRLRRARGLSQRRLAEAAHVSVSTINRLEHDRRAAPSASTRSAIARVLGMGVGDVFPDASG